MDKSFLAAKQKGSLLAGSRYEKAIEFFIRRRSSQRSYGASRENQKTERREENKGDFIKYCKENGLQKGKTVLDRCSKQFCFFEMWCFGSSDYKMGNAYWDRAEKT